MLTVGPLNALEGVRHCFYSRDGGVSEGLYASLNCGLGSGDDRRRVLENRRRALERLDLDPATLRIVHQVHGTEVADADAPWPAEAPPRADAMVATGPSATLGILTADCAPVLFADAEARIVGAAHAGWRGALAGTIEATVAVMAARGADRRRVFAAIGPCIARRSYEVGLEFERAFLAADATYASFFSLGARPDKRMFDLRAFIVRRLYDSGLHPDRVHVMPHDTVAEERFFSYRRAVLRGEPDYGRSLSVIALE